jgi:glycerol-3-phosphate dehydrogenase
MDRHQLLQHLQESSAEPWDILIIGGGATGLGTALDSASRGFRTLLLEQEDFAKGTSSRSTKLVHGGVRYLAEGDIGLVREALHERGLLLKNAPHLVHIEHFIIPIYTRWSAIKYTLGLMTYDLLSGRASFGPSRYISKEEVVRRLPGIRKDQLRGGVIYQDGQFNDSRLAINLAQTAVEHGALVFNHFGVTGLLKSPKGKICGVKAQDRNSGETYELTARTVINATGVFVDDILQMDEPEAFPQVRPSQGVHLVMEQSFLGSADALLIPKTDDGRVLFGVPWEGKLLVGTTDTPLNIHSLEPRALEEEINFILHTAGQYMEQAPTRADVLSVFAGLRPLAAPKKGESSTKEISRSHKIIRSPSGLITITGGKWTTYRRMAEDTVNTAIEVANLRIRACATQHLKIHGASGTVSATLPATSRTTSATSLAASGTPTTRPSPAPNRDHLALYGSDHPHILALQAADPNLAIPLHPRLPFTGAEVIWAVRQECALTIEDVLARRVRALFLDAKASIEMAPKVAALMRAAMEKDAEWEAAQIQAYTTLAKGYLLE